jgi:TatD DNase family protein
MKSWLFMTKQVEGKIIDSHIHFDMYPPYEQQQILSDSSMHHVVALISVSYHLKSCIENLRLSQVDERIKPAFGYHPEQRVPSNEELQDILSFMNRHKETMAAVGEVGLPYYLRQEQPGFDVAPYMELLQVFVQEAKSLNKPIILHAVYDDADPVISMLEDSSIQKAHFHWFKGSSKTLEKMKGNGYYISLTPDLVYEEEIRSIAEFYPLTQILVETDGPWKFEGPFKGKMTHPGMIHQTVKELAKIKKESLQDVYKVLLDNTRNLYSI